MLNHPPVQKPLSLIGEGVAATQAAFSNSGTFGYNGMAFIGEFGTAAPLIHPFAQVTTPLPGIKPNITGQKVVMLDPKTGNYSDFLSLSKPDRSFHPVGVKFDLKGDSMYVTSYGKVEIRTSNPAGLSGTDHLAFGAGLYPFATIHAMVWPYANTGVVWKISKVNTNTNTNTTTTAGTTPQTTKSTGSLTDYIMPPLSLAASKSQPVSNATSATISNQTSTQATNNVGANITNQRNNAAPTGIPGVP
jgi:hypothetical protein